MRIPALWVVCLVAVIKLPLTLFYTVTKVSLSYVSLVTKGKFQFVHAIGFAPVSMVKSQFGYHLHYNELSLALAKAHSTWLPWPPLHCFPPLGPGEQ